MAGRDTVEMAKRILKHHDVAFDVERNKHCKIRVQHDGKTRTLVTGGSISDHRAVLNFYATIKRILIELGVQFRPDSKQLLFN